MTTSQHYQRVQKFHELAQQPIRHKPTIPPLKERELRARLLLEETFETVKALGFTPYVANEIFDYHPLDHDDIRLEADCEPDIFEIADGCADVSVINTGTMIACGIYDVPLLEEVDNNNLAKFGPGGYRRDDGKWVKPPNHPAPDISGVLNAQNFIDGPGGVPMRVSAPGYDTSSFPGGQDRSNEDPDDGEELDRGPIPG